MTRRAAVPELAETAEASDVDDANALSSDLAYVLKKLFGSFLRAF